MRGIPNMGMRNQVFPSIIHRLVAFTPFSAPESHQSNGMRAWNIDNARILAHFRIPALT